MSTEKKKVVIILGMHRSGTSALSGLLNRAGIDFGNNLIPPNNDNPTGFFEDWDILKMNNFMLEAQNSSWYSIKPLNKSWKNLSRSKKRLTHYLKRKISKSNIYGIKDPRIIRLFPVWKEIFRDLELSPCFIIIVRDVRAVCESLRKRNCFSPLFSSIFWAIENLNSEKQTRGYKRVFLSYEDLLKDPMTCIGKIKDHLELTKSLPDRGQHNIGSFIKTHFNRSKDTKRIDDFNIAEPILKLSKDLAILTKTDNAFESAKTRKNLDKFSKALASSRDFAMASYHQDILAPNNTSQRIIFMVYLNYGNGFSNKELISISSRIVTKGFKHSIVLLLKDDLESIRIDPVTSLGTLFNFKLQIDVNGKIIRFNRGNERHFMIKNMIASPDKTSFLSINDDPMIEFQLNAKKGTRIRISCSFVFEPYKDNKRNRSFFGSIHEAIQKEKTAPFLKRLLNKC